VARVLGLLLETLTIAPDYEPIVDLERFPRENVHFPKPEDNKHGAWAWKVDIKDKKPPPRTESSPPELLKGKTVVLKDNIGVKDVPMLMGTKFVKDYVPVSFRFHCYWSSADFVSVEHRCHSRHPRPLSRRPHHRQSRLREPLPQRNFPLCSHRACPKPLCPRL
jgi:hypothetical protein